MPRITLKRRPSSRKDSPGLSSVPASIEPIITLSAPAASALTTSPEYLTPPSAITGTSAAPCTPSRIAVIWGIPTPVTTRVVQIEPGPTPTFTASTPRSTSARAPSAVATLPPTSCASGNASRRHATALSTPSEWPCAESTTITSQPAPSRARGRASASALPPTAAATRSRPCWSLLASGCRRRLKMSLMVMRPFRMPCASTTGSFHDRHARDAEPLHQPHRLAHRAVGAEGDGVEDHPRLAALHPVHLRRLAVDRHVLVDHADSPLARDGDRHLGLGHGVHGRRHERDVERDAAGEAGAHVHVARVHRGMPRYEENVVESEGGAGAEGSHGESYWEGGGSSTLPLSSFFFCASSTAALPAAATRSSSFPAFPTASIVPLMMFTGTRPARSVSSSVSATLWNGAAPAGRSAYFDSRNST